MPAFSQQLQRILIFDPDNARATVSVFYDSYTPDGSDTPCYIFLVAEIRSTNHQNNQHLIREIQNLLFRFFSSSRSRMTETLFEEGLHEVNKMLPTLLTEHPADFLEDISFVVGTVYGNTLHFSQAGDTIMLYLHGAKIMDIADHSVDGNINPLKVFQEVGTGKIEPDNYLFIGTTNFLDYFSQEKIRRLIDETDDEMIAKRFDEHLAQAPLSTTFGALLVSVKTGKATSVDEYIQKTQNVPQPQKRMRSIEELIQREESTDEILSPKILPAIYRKTKSFSRSLKMAFRKRVLKKPTRVSPIVLEKEEQRGEEIREAYLRKLRHSTRGKAARKVSKSFSGLSYKFGVLLKKVPGWLKISAKKTRQSLAPEVRSEEKRKINILKWFNRLSLRRKIVFVVLVLVVVVFAQSMVSIGYRQKQEGKNEQTQTQIQTIRDEMAEIDAAFLYGDEGRVREAITTIEQQLTTLPENDETNSLKTDAQKKIADARLSLKKIRTIASPTLLTDLTNQTENGAVEAIVSTGSVLYSIVPEKNIIVRTIKESGESISIQSKESSIPQYITTLGTSAVVVHQDLTVSEIRSGANTITSLTSSLPTDANIASIATYLNRLYLLDINQNQILRSNKGASSYGIPSLWLSENSTNFASAQSIAIDGSIYVGFKEGVIRKYTQGTQDAFSLQELDDPIQALTSIWTDDSSDSLYVLDAATRRVIQYDKEGKLIEQFFFEGLPSIASFAIDEVENTVYILSAGKIYSEPITITE